MYSTAQHPNSMLDFYKYLTVLTDAQITKLRNIAIGLSPLQAFSAQEIQQLESKLILDQHTL